MAQLPKWGFTTSPSGGKRRVQLVALDLGIRAANHHGGAEMSDLEDDGQHLEPRRFPPDRKRLLEIYRQIDEAHAEYLRRVAPLLKEIGGDFQD